MNIKTYLEDDTVLFNRMVNLVSRCKVISSLNSRGIFTIEDFINYNERDYPINSRRFYQAMSHIFECAYLDKKLVYDSVLRKHYVADYNGCVTCSHDLQKIGIKGYGSARSVLDLISDDENEPIKKGKTTFSMKQVLELVQINSGISNAIRSYYLDYLDDEKTKMKHDEDDLLLNSTREELETMLEVMKELVYHNKMATQKIIELQERINRLEAKQDTYQKQLKKDE